MVVLNIAITLFKNSVQLLR